MDLRRRNLHLPTAKYDIMAEKRRLTHKWKNRDIQRRRWAALSTTVLAVLFMCTLVKKMATHDPIYSQSLHSNTCPRPCLDAVIPYHEADEAMLVRNGGLVATKTHLKDVQNIYIVSLSNRTFDHLLDERTRWYDEAHIPFFPQMSEGNISGWKYQQALKFWSVQHIPGLCNNVLILDSDVLWIRDFEIVVPTMAHSDGICTTPKFKYNIATAASGAWESDIYSSAYHSFVEYFTGLPKMNADTLTAINHWQVMQRDVLQALTKSLLARTQYSVEEAILRYGSPNQYDMTEYEAYYSFISYFYSERVETVSLPYIIRQPTLCNYYNASALSSLLKGPILYLACHDKYDREDFYVNCNGKACRTG